MSGTIIHRKRRKLKSEINVVPYIDVMLVLLIIFMVTAPLLTLSVDVKLPSSNARATSEQTDPTVVLAYTDGRFGLTLPGAGRPETLDAETLTQRISAFRSQQGSEMRVLVAADGQGPYQNVLNAMDVLRRAGVTNVSLLTEPGGDAR